MKLSYVSKMYLRMFDKESDYKLHKYVEDLLSEDVERQQQCLCTLKQFFKQTKDMKYFFLLAYGRLYCCNGMRGCGKSTTFAHGL